MATGITETKGLVFKGLMLKPKTLKERRRRREREKHETVTLNLAIEIPAAIELFCSWNPDFRSKGSDGVGFGVPEDDYLEEASAIIGDDPALTTICVTLCLLFCNLAGGASETQSEAITKVAETLSGANIDDAIYVFEKILEKHQ